MTVALTPGLFFAPLYYQSGDIVVDALGIGTVDTIAEAFLVSGIGLLSGIVTLPLTGLFAAIWRGLSTLMLGGGSDYLKYSKRTVTTEKVKQTIEDEYFDVVHIAQPIHKQDLVEGSPDFGYDSLGVHDPILGKLAIVIGKGKTGV